MRGASARNRAEIEHFRSQIRVVHLTTVHDARDPRIFFKEARSLAGAGYSVTVVGRRKELSGSLDMASDEAVRICYLPGMRRRSSRMMVLPIIALLWVARLGPTIVHVHDPELIPVGLLLKLLRKRVVYDMHEDLPKQVLSKEWIPETIRPILSRLILLLEPVALKAFDLVVVANPATSLRLHVGNQILVRNLPAIETFVSGRTRLGQETPKRAVYIGGIERSRGAAEMLAAIALSPPELKVQLVLAGPIDKTLLSELEVLPGWDSTEYLGVIDPPRVSELLSTCDVGLVILHPTPNYLNNLPTKLFEYMAAGLPVVVSDFPHLRDIVAAARCGIVVDPLSPRQIVDAMVALCSNPALAQEMGRNGRVAAVRDFSWTQEASRLVENYDALSQGPRLRRPRLRTVSRGTRAS